MKFSVRSRSSGEIYDIRVVQSAGPIAILCTCAAAENGTHCKHRLALISGDAGDLVGGTHSIEDLRAAIAGSNIEAAIRRVSEQEALIAAEQAKLKAAKKALSQALMGR